MPHARTPAEVPAVLVVEDDADIRDLVAALLRDEGYRAVPASGHAAALAILGEARFALVLADAEARGAGDPARWDGLERLRAAAGGAPVAICSAHPPDAFADFAARGFAALVPKPFDADELLATVRRLAGPPAQA